MVRVSARARSRFAGPLLLLVAVLALVVPLVNCSAATAATHEHTTIPTRIAAPADGGAALWHCVRHPADTGCLNHLGHCVPDTVLPGDRDKAAPRAVATLALAVLRPAAVSAPPVERPRGPPASRVPAVSGRDVLTHLCIARR
ncbi:hypothetical protein BJY24_000226 [Nocardia transvalensis]|uniref:Secreted protein n=1 Tax=Nocardia transvalensis TaxID=37333 RepID=A0A7W9UFM4_9NOCA|nr:hypothetical protein [Nocardia transvalensis]MBB5911359.1 hypothetical protein [Nocardia transvalensis]